MEKFIVYRKTITYYYGEIILSFGQAKDKGWGLSKKQRGEYELAHSSSAPGRQ